MAISTAELATLPSELESTRIVALNDALLDLFIAGIQGPGEPLGSSDESALNRAVHEALAQEAQLN